MKKLGIITNFLKDGDFIYTNQVLSLCEKYGIEAKRLERYRKDNGCYAVIMEKFDPEIEAVIVLGGDGTLLRVARDLKYLDLPLLGINLGHLGYLTEVEVSGMEEAIKNIAEDNFYVEERMMLRGIPLQDPAEEEKQHVAMNDIILNRVGQVRLITIDLYVNGQLLHKYQADGLIFSTPTGSTAYNLSAGGPIIEPTTTMIVVTPVCSHQLDIRSIVLSGDDVLEARVSPDSCQGESDKVGVTLDGDVLCSLAGNERIRIERAKQTAKLIRFREMSFLDTLHQKMK